MPQRRAHRARGHGPEAPGVPHATHTPARWSRRRPRSHRPLPDLRRAPPTCAEAPRPRRSFRLACGFGRARLPSLPSPVLRGGDPRHHPCAGITRIRFGRSAARMPPSQPMFEGSRCGSMVLRRLRDSRACRSTEHTACDGSAPRGSTSCAKACRMGAIPPDCSTPLCAAARTSSSCERSRPGARRRSSRWPTRFVMRRREHGALFILNDRPDLVAECGADGVHVGQEDTSVAEARELAGPAALVGLSTHSPEQVEAACAAAGDDRPDQISVGPVWETPTKAGRPATGLQLIEFAAREATVPWFAIGGIDVGNVAEAAARRSLANRRRAGDSRRRGPGSAPRAPCEERWTTRPAPLRPSRPRRPHG